MRKESSRAGQRSGFDAAATDREHDYLDRWPFAQEIYGIATTGRQDWSVRIGVYGEWGSGKTSVLNFIREMGKAHGDVVVPFNPWQFDSTSRLWKNFVDGVLTELELALGPPTRNRSARKIKTAAGKGIEILPKVVGIWKTEAGNAVESGLEYLKRFFSFGPEDINQIRGTLGDRRIIVLVDDLDRADAKLVPQMLFALKEVMDIPGIAFVCAFDPAVVGEVLAEVHSGFKDGLKFLDKIIDYPRWLPEPGAAQLAALASADAIEAAPYVPREALSDSINLLPTNPRAIRQFVRLLALLAPQVARHAEREIHWPILLAANVAKVRFPKLAPQVLGDSAFWHSLYRASFPTDEKKEDKKHTIVTDRVNQLTASGRLDASSAPDLERCLLSIADKLEIWFGIAHESLMYQFHIAERPCAVTWKEFDELITAKSGPKITKIAISEWIPKHATLVDQPERKVFSEIVDAAIHARLTALNKAADATGQAEMRAHMKLAEKLMRFLRVVLLQLGSIEKDQPRITASQVKALLESFAQYFSWSSGDTNKKARAQEKDLLLALAGKWGPDAMPLVEGIGLQTWEGQHDLRGAEWQSLIEELRKIIRPKVASWIVSRFLDSPSFFKTVLHNEQYGYTLRSLFLARNGPLWVDVRHKMLSALRTSATNEFVRQNAYDVMQWFDYLLRKTEPESSEVNQLLADAEIATALWSAAITDPLSPRAVGSIQTLGERLKNEGIWTKQPDWWQSIVTQFNIKPSGD